MNFITSVRQSWDRMRSEHLAKAIAKRLPGADEAAMEAAEMGSVVSPAFEAFQMYGVRYRGPRPGITDKTGLTFQYLRRWVDACPVEAAIVNRIVENPSAYAKPADDAKFGIVQQPGFRVRLTDRKQKATPADVEAMALWTKFFSEAGFCPPPESERPLGWQPGLEYVIRCIVRDSTILDQAPILRYPSASDPKRFPVVSFVPMDGALIRRSVGEVVDIKNGVPVWKPYDKERMNTRDDVRFVRLGTEVGGIPIEEYTEQEMAIWVRNPRTDINRLGYGVSEVEQAVNIITQICYANEYNMSRFRNDTLPRGILFLNGKVDTQGMAAFRLMWEQLLRGLANRWNIPILSSPTEGAKVEWIDIDRQTRDMEYAQALYTLIIWLHAIHRVHPEETGFAATSPFRPPLNQASPDVQLEWSQDNNLRPLLRSLENFFNREVLWLNVPDKRYTFEFTGIGVSPLEEESLISLMFQNGTITPREIRDARDQEIPAAWEGAMWPDLPMPPIEGIRLEMEFRQMAMQQQQMDVEQSQAELAAMQAQGAAQGQMVGPDGQSISPPPDAANMAMATAPGTQPVAPAQVQPDTIPVSKAMQFIDRNRGGRTLRAEIQVTKRKRRHDFV